MEGFGNGKRNLRSVGASEVGVLDATRWNRAGAGVKPKEIIIEDKSTLEQMELIQQLDEEDKTTVFKIIDKMLTTKKFKDFFNKNVAVL